MVAALGSQDLTGPCTGVTHGKVTQALGPSGHLPSGVGLGPASPEKEVSISWRVACPPCAVISSDHLREHG